MSGIVSQVIIGLIMMLFENPYHAQTMNLLSVDNNRWEQKEE